MDTILMPINGQYLVLSRVILPFKNFNPKYEFLSLLEGTYQFLHSGLEMASKSYNYQIDIC